MLRASDVTVRYGDVVAVREVDLSLRAGRGRRAHGPQRLGQVVAAVGAAGQRHALRRTWSMWRAPTPARSEQARPGPWSGWCPRRRRPALPGQRRRGVPHRPTPTPPAPPGRVARLLDRLVPGIDGATHPRDLSEGQRLALALAVQLTAEPRVVLLDEPTRGLDQHAKEASARRRRRARRRRSTRWSSAPTTSSSSPPTADRVVVLAEGEIVADGPTAEVVVASPAFAPQVAKVLAPQPWLTVARGRRRARRGARQ